mgnify:CR=1 FL=1
MFFAIKSSSYKKLFSYLFVNTTLYDRFILQKLTSKFCIGNKMLIENKIKFFEDKKGGQKENFTGQMDISNKKTRLMTGFIISKRIVEN